MNRKIAVIGGGAAGLEASSALASLGFRVMLVEKEDETGGHIRNWHALFPNRRPGAEVIDALRSKLSSEIELYTGKTITEIKPVNNRFEVGSADGWKTEADAVLLTTGFSLFNARKKEEYGYGIYDNVITSADLESAFPAGRVTMKNGELPKRIGFVHCVGSRDEKAGNIYCSKVCCVTAVKQAIEIRQFLPECEVFCFYMDMRMFGRHYEELYKEAQEKYYIQFIRGRLSESTEDHTGKIILKVEDTLLGKPLKIGVDMLVLMVGMESPDITRKLGSELGLVSDSDRFLVSADQHLSVNTSETPGLFFAGTCTGPKNIADTLADARSAALAIASYFENDPDKS